MASPNTRDINQRCADNQNSTIVARLQRKRKASNNNSDVDEPKTKSARLSPSSPRKSLRKFELRLSSRFHFEQEVVSFFCFLLFKRTFCIFLPYFSYRSLITKFLINFLFSLTRSMRSTMLSAKLLWSIPFVGWIFRKLVACL